MCMVLLLFIEKAVKELDGTIVPHDTFIDELRELAEEQDIESEDLAIAMAAYMLGFGSYKGFHNVYKELIIKGQYNYKATSYRKTKSV